MAKNKKAQILAAVMCAATVAGVSPAISSAAEYTISSGDTVTVNGTKYNGEQLNELFTYVGDIQNAGIVAGTMDEGTASTGAISMGENSKVHGTGSIAIGKNSNVSKFGSVALGIGANANASGSVALGAYSIANEDNTVSIGRAGSERRIVNVADGINETDAATVGQLNAVKVNVDGIERVDANKDGVADTTIIEGQTTISDDGKFTTANNRFSVTQQGDIRTRNDANGDWTFEVDSATGDINTQGKVIANGANINGEFNANNGQGAIISTNGDNVYVSTTKGFLNVTGDSTVLGHGSNTVTLDGNGATFYTGDASKGATTIMGGTISTNKLLVGGVDVAGTAVDVADRVQDITHGGTADDHWTKVENTFFNSDGSMNTANGNFIVTKEGKAQSTQDFVIMGENNTALYSLKDIGYTTSEIQYNTQHITHSNIDGVDWTKVEGVYFNADGSMNVGNGNFIVLNDGTVDSLKDIKTK